MEQRAGRDAARQFPWMRWGGGTEPAPGARAVFLGLPIVLLPLEVRIMTLGGAEDEVRSRPV